MRCVRHDSQLDVLLAKTSGRRTRQVLQGEVVRCWLWAMKSQRVDGT
jgi:hypothetical protein